MTQQKQIINQESLKLTELERCCGCLKMGKFDLKFQLFKFQLFNQLNRVIALDTCSKSSQVDE